MVAFGVLESRDSSLPSLQMHTRIFISAVFAGLLTAATACLANDPPKIQGVAKQPFAAQVERVVQALKHVGAPLTDEETAAVAEAIAETDETSSVVKLQDVLDQLVVATVTINPESRVSAVTGPAEKTLVEQGWSTFLLKVHNEAGVTAPLAVSSPQALPAYQTGRGARQRPSTADNLVSPSESALRFLDVEVFNKPPLLPNLSGLEVEYRILQLFSRDAGLREATLVFNVGQGTQDLGFRSEVPILFDCKPSTKVVLDVRDETGAPTTAAFVIKDTRGRIYPNPARRIAPDFFFHEQVYRSTGETVSLPPGMYSISVSRGPEYETLQRSLTVFEGMKRLNQSFRLQRWVHPLALGWVSGDHHVHAAGCKHYDSPTEGVGPRDMMRHILGEDLNVGCVLTWGPCWYSQKKNFEGGTSSLSIDNYLMRYDIEVSGFPSSHAGHLCLLRLAEDDYPGTKLIEEWPSWTLPVLKWGKSQGGVVGYSHSGWGLALPDVMPNGSRQFTNRPWGGAKGNWTGRAADTLPDYAMPRFDGIGANEFIVTVANDACDFISAVDTPAIWELNIWYHTLNCGYRARVSGETDFPCIYGDKVGLGRIYVKHLNDEPVTFDSWVHGLKDGRSYCGDGLSHIFDFKVNNVAVGEPGSHGEISQLDLAGPQRVAVTCEVAAMLDPEPTEATERIRNRRLDEKPYWHIERCRIGDSRRVPVELVVNGEVIETREIEADGTPQPLKFDTLIDRSSWIALRILPSVHTNPIFVEVDGRPIRASQRSAEWCRKAVDVCWDSKQGLIRESERDAASAAYDVARRAFDRILAESK